MAFAIGAANIPSIGEWLNPGVAPRMEPHGAGVYPAIRARNDSSPAAGTVNMFVDGVSPDFEYAASVVSVCVGTTVYALQCTSGPPVSGTTYCGPNAAVATLTSGSDKYVFSSSIATNVEGIQATVVAQETCALGGTTAAICTATLKVAASGTSTTSSSTETLTGTSYHRYDVAITGGAEKTANPTTCAKSAASNVNPKNMLAWALAGVMGTSVLAML